MAMSNDCSWIIVRVCFSNYKYGYMDRDLVLSLILKHTRPTLGLSRRVDGINQPKILCISAFVYESL